MKNYFELLKINVSFDINLQKLEANYKEKLNQNHPDKFAHADEDQMKTYLQNTSYINEAYISLKNPISRAEHILQIISSEFEAQNNIVETKFLFEQMGFQERIQEISENFNENEFKQLSKEIKKLYEKNIYDMQQQLKNKNWLAAEQCLLKAKMFNSLEKKLSTTEDKFYEKL